MHDDKKAKIKRLFLILKYVASAAIVIYKLAKKINGLRKNDETQVYKASKGKI